MPRKDVDENMIRVQKKFLSAMKDQKMAKTMQSRAKTLAKPKVDWSSGNPRPYERGEAPSPSRAAVSNKLQGQIVSKLGPDVAKRVYNIARKASGLPKVAVAVGNISMAVDFAKGVEQGRAMAEKNTPTRATFAGKPVKRKRG